MAEEDLKEKKYNTTRFDYHNENDYIDDYIPESEMIKIYPYRATQSGKNDSLMEANTIVTVIISQDVIDYSNLDKDENGNRYLKIFASINNENTLSVPSSSSSFKKQLRNIKQFVAITNNSYPISNDDNEVDFFTIGEPFNQDVYDKNDLPIYYSPTFYNSEENTIQTLVSEHNVIIEDTTTVSELELRDVRTLENPSQLSLIRFTNKKLNLENINSISLEVQPTIFIDGILGKGKLINNDKLENINIDFHSKDMSWSNFIPINTEEKIEWVNNWLDDNWTIEKPIVDWITETKNNSVSWSEFCTKLQLDNSIKKLILEMVLYTYEYDARFKDVPRNEQGALTPSYNIGAKGSATDTISTQVAAIANENPLQTINGLYNVWKKRYPHLLKLNQHKILKSFIVAFSSEISSPLSIAMGNNDFNKNLLPWRFILKDPLDVTVTFQDLKNKEKGGLIELKDFTFQVDIENNIYFPYNKATKKLDIPNKIDLSESNFINGDRKVTLPKLPNQLGEINKSHNPGDVDTTNSKDMKYMLKIPLNSEETNMLFSNQKIKSGERTINLDFSFDNFIENKNNKHKMSVVYWSQQAIKKIKKMYPDAKDIKFINQGKIKSIRDSDRFTYRTEFRGNSGWFWNDVSQVKNNASVDSQFNNFLLKGDYGESDANNKSWFKKIFTEFDYRFSMENKWFFEYEINSGNTVGKFATKSLTIPNSQKLFTNAIGSFYDLVDINDVNISTFELGEEVQDWGGFNVFKYGFDITRKQWINMKVSFKTSINAIQGVDRETIFDKAKYKDLIKTIISNSQKPTLDRVVKLERKYEDKIYSLKEIILYSVNGDYINFTFDNGDSLSFELWQSEEEGVVKQKFKFY